MNRDNVLFLVIGVLTGFISGYLMHEVMAARQPAPRRADAAANVAAARGGSGVPAATAKPGAQPGMEQVQRLRAHVENNPDDAPAVRQLANLNYDIRNWERAAELYQQYLRLVPEDLDVMTDLGAVYRFLGQPREALQQFQQVLGRAPERWQARYNEVLVLAFDLEDFASAGSAMAELRQQQPDNPEVTRLAEEVNKRIAGAGG